MREGAVTLRPDTGRDLHSATPSWPLSSSLPLGAFRTATPCARLHARAVLTEWGLRGLAETAELIVSELVTNAVRASAGPDGRARYGEAGLPVVVLRLFADATRVLIEVWDEIPSAPVTEHADPDDESGRGLMLIEAVSDLWTWATVPGWTGKVVSAELVIPPGKSGVLPTRSGLAACRGVRPRQHLRQVRPARSDRTRVTCIGIAGPRSCPSCAIGRYSGNTPGRPCGIRRPAGTAGHRSGLRCCSSREYSRRGTRS